MHLSLPLAISMACLAAAAAATTSKPPSKDAILLSKVQSLTLRGAGATTTHRRVPAAPQLKCLSHRALCNLHAIDVMRCTNNGAGYGPEDIQWSCVTSLPEELKLGSTDVVCEGYGHPDDPYVLRGSCGVEYRLALTDKGERRYPNLGKGRGGGGGGGGKSGRDDDETDWGAYLFAFIFFSVLAWILYSACVAGTQNRRTGGTGRRRGGGGGGGPGGGGGGGWNPGFGQDDDPPPPYPGTKSSSSSDQQGWRPGFWTGAGAGGAAGYGAGYYQGRNSARNQQNYGSGWGGDTTSGSSSYGAGPSRSTSSSSSSARHESTGFGSTSRR
ncbi:hypothetical protein BDP81DRAFT_379981 [Colletotrichum phormii]|uniref:Store-operated calcium entry-associated regulatory factor n=1 Tax=Colletotrichum phormii TaxID=359342 RepID=A0AAI9ZKI7_9PEZI|nr:uncharacterized protein BDP81DRAFT_379981 [Colletotrichum phormii]KAK1633676.1 hypothetical protein BDP81DRAFT_379981 [Colletotrichum phormii]